jgi:hypothetical protein
MARMTDGWYRQEVIKIVMISSMLSSDQKYVHLLILLNHKAWIWRLGLLRYISGSRRRFVDRLVLAIAIVINVF